MSYIPALHRRTGYAVIPPMPPSGNRRPQGPQPTPMQQAFHIVLQEFTALLERAPDLGSQEGEGMCSAIRQLADMAMQSRRRA